MPSFKESCRPWCGKSSEHRIDPSVLAASRVYLDLLVLSLTHVAGWHLCRSVPYRTARTWRAIPCERDLHFGQASKSRWALCDRAVDSMIRGSESSRKVDGEKRRTLAPPHGRCNRFWNCVSAAPLRVWQGYKRASPARRPAVTCCCTPASVCLCVLLFALLGYCERRAALEMPQMRQSDWAGLVVVAGTEVLTDSCHR